MHGNVARANRKLAKTNIIEAHLQKNKTHEYIKII